MQQCNGHLVKRDGADGMKYVGAILSLTEFAAGPEVHGLNVGVWKKNSGAAKDADMRVDSRWYGGLQSVSEYREMLSAGWAEGRERTQQCSEEMATVPELASLDIAPRQRQRRWCDDGDSVDYDRLRNGDIDTMWQGWTRTRAGVMPTISIVFAWGGLASRSSEELVWGGAAALALADRFEQAGFSVELIALSISDQHDGTAALLATRVKASDEPLNIGALSAICCHPAAFRVGVFQQRCGLPTRIASTQGRTMDISNYDWEASGIPLEGTPLVLPHVYSLHEAVQSVRTVLREGHALKGEEVGSDWEHTH